MLDVVRFGGLLKPTAEQLEDLREMIEECEDLYPGIDIWFDRKVLGDLNDKSRSAYLVYDNGEPVGSTVVKLGKKSKICSLRIRQEAEMKGYGSLLMALAARDMRNTAQAAYFTIPEHIWESKCLFFEQYGFRNDGMLGQQYRLWDKEIVCTASFWNVWLNVLATIPKLTRSVRVNGLKSNYDLVISVRPEFAQGLMSGCKKVEVRRRFSDSWEGSHALVYSTRPQASFVGSFVIDRVVCARPAEIWASFGTDIGSTHEQFMEYTSGAQHVWALVAGDRIPFKFPIPLTQLSRLVSSDIDAPQSYCRMRQDSAMEEAASICTILQSTL